MKNALIILISLLILIAPAQAPAEIGKIASWYGGGEKLNKHTANGDVFNPKEMTCASWHYPFDTRLKITNIENEIILLHLFIKILISKG